MDWSLCPYQAPHLEINEATDGVLVYQRDRDRLHFLNPTAALLLVSCDGALRADELPELVATVFGMDEQPVDDVATCLMTLLREGLLIADVDP